MKKLLLTTTITAMSLLSVAHAEKLILATDGTLPPFAEVSPNVTTNDGMVGFDIDIGMALCKQMKVQCEFKRIDWDGLIPALKTHKIDAIVASMNATDERRKSISFSAPYYSNPGIFVARKDSHIAYSKEGMAGKTLGVQRGTIFDTYATDKLSGWVNIKKYVSQDEANQDARAGRIDILFADKIVLKDGFLNRNEGKDFAEFGPELKDEKYFGEGISIGVRKNDKELADRFSKAIKEIRANGEYKKVNDKYFKYDIYGLDEK